jgi:hypothetical protein
MIPYIGLPFISVYSSGLNKKRLLRKGLTGSSGKPDGIRIGSGFIHDLISDTKLQEIIKKVEARILYGNMFAGVGNQVDPETVYYAGNAMFRNIILFDPQAEVEIIAGLIRAEHCVRE